MIDLGLIRPYHPPSVIQGPILVSTIKVQICFAMSDREEKAFGLDHSLHTSFFEVKTNGAWGEGFIYDAGEGFGDLDSIFCPMTGDEMDGMTDIGGGKLLWMTISGLLKLRMLFGVQSRVSEGMDTSSVKNLCSWFYCSAWVSPSTLNRVGTLACLIKETATTSGQGIGPGTR